ncbi:MAG: sulfurtransferase [Candidatus Nitrosomaritimum yanchengensis]
MLVSIVWLRKNLSDKNLVILDTRPKPMFLYGHLENSQNVTLEHVIKFDQYGSNLVLDEKEASTLFGSLGIDHTKTVVLVGDSMDPSSARIAWTLMYYGHEKTFLLDANVSQLKEKGFEFTRQIFSLPSLIFNPKINNEIRIDAKYLKENLNKFEILDARTLQEFMVGHLPNSKLIPFTEGISYGGKLFKDRADLEQHFLNNKISKKSQIVCYCMHGHRASSLFFQLVVSGFPYVELCDGSFIDWHGSGLALE